MSPELWEEIQEKLENDLARERRRVRYQEGALLLRTGATLTLRALLEAGAFKEGIDGYVQEWMSEGGVGQLPIGSVLVFPPELPSGR